MTKPHSSATLYLIPSSIGDDDLSSSWPPGHLSLINTLDVFIVEHLRTARRFLKRTGYSKDFSTVTFYEIDKHASATDCDHFLGPARDGISIGMLSEAGTPCVADPGQHIVQRAHELSIQVKPLVGPNSILLALMGSGLNGQEFCFHGYLPVRQDARRKKIRELESRSQHSGATQIFMETPYRNHSMAEDLVSQCRTDTLLCIAADLTTENEYIKTRTIGNWRQSGLPGLHKRPAIFLLLRQPAAAGNG